MEGHYTLDAAYLGGVAYLFCTNTTTYNTLMPPILLV